MKDKNFAIFLLFVTAFLGGAMIPLVKIVLQTMPPLTFTFIRFFVSSLVFIPILRREKNRLKDIKELIPLALLPSINIILFIIAIRFTSANLGQMIYVTVPVIVTILAHFLLKEKITISKATGIFLGVFGGLTLLLSKTVKGYSFENNLFGGLVILAGSIFFSLFVIYSKKIQKKFSPSYITFAFFITTTIISSAMSIIEFRLIPLWIVNFNWLLALNIFIISVVGTASYYLLQQWVIKHGSATLGSTINFIQPGFTFIWAGFLLGEKVTDSFLIAAIMIVTGAWLVTRES